MKPHLKRALALALGPFVALSLCERVTLFGFGNGSLDCVLPHQTVCSKYYGLALEWRHLCALPRNLSPYYRLEDYVNQSAFHDMDMERQWLETAVRDPATTRLQSWPCPIRHRSRKKRAKMRAERAAARDGS